MPLLPNQNSSRQERLQGVRELLNSMRREGLGTRSLLKKMARMRMVQMRKEGRKGKVSMMVRKEDMVNMIEKISESFTMSKMIEVIKEKMVEKIREKIQERIQEKIKNKISAFQEKNEPKDENNFKDNLFILPNTKARQGRLPGVRGLLNSMKEGMSARALLKTMARMGMAQLRNKGAKDKISIGIRKEDIVKMIEKARKMRKLIEEMKELNDDIKIIEKSKEMIEGIKEINESKKDIKGCS